jgi:predicted CXXCH cytochrome family protein
MNSLKWGLVIGAAVVLALAAGGVAYAFHSGGVAECVGCHSMHSPTSPSKLLVASDPSSTCLTCHEHAGDTGPSSYHISTANADLGAGKAPLQRTPGGDFGWLRKTYTFSTETESGDLHGHNVVAVDKSLTVDGRNATAPGGGTFPAANLGCQSCHDPHGTARRLADGTYVRPVATAGATYAPIIGSGSYPDPAPLTAGQARGVYRLLRGLNDSSQGVTFSGVAIAVVANSYNKKEDTPANQVRVAYGAAGSNTWGNWCATCHPNMHSSGNNVHPVDASLNSAVFDNYNAYVKSGDLGGSASTAFLSLVPFVQNTGDIAQLAAKTTGAALLTGPETANDKVSCVSCHRAHASGWPYALRWNMEYEFVTTAPSGTTLYVASDNGSVSGSRAPLQHRGRTAAEVMAAYYDRPASQWASYQRVLCNKCHAKD